jgi:hypothetical protein
MQARTQPSSSFAAIRSWRTPLISAPSRPLLSSGELGRKHHSRMGRKDSCRKLVLCSPSNMNSCSTTADNSNLVGKHRPIGSSTPADSSKGAASNIPTAKSSTVRGSIALSPRRRRETIRIQTTISKRSDAIAQFERSDSSGCGLRGGCDGSAGSRQIDASLDLVAGMGSGQANCDGFCATPQNLCRKVGTARKCGQPSKDEISY